MTNHNRDSKRHIQRVYDFMANEPDQRVEMVKEWKELLLNRRKELEEGVAESRIYLYVKDWKYCLACQQWEDEIHGKSEHHLKRVARFMKMTSREQAFYLAEQKNKVEMTLRGGMQASGTEELDEVTPVLEDLGDMPAEEPPARLAPPVSQDNASSSRDHSGDGNAAGAVASACDDDDNLTDSESDSALRKALVDSVEMGPCCAGGDGELGEEVVRHKLASYTIGLQTSRVRTVLYVCPHVLIETIRSVVAGIHAVSPTKICFVENGRLVPNTFRVMDWSNVADMEWQATSSPMAGCPSLFKLRPTCAVIYPAQNVLCKECLDEADAAQICEEDDIELARALKEARAQAIESLAMRKEDMDVCWAKVIRPRESIVVQFYRGLTVEELHQHLSRKKRVRQTAHQVMRPASLTAEVQDEEELTWTPVKAARGGSLRITIQYDDHEFQAAIAQEDKVCDLLRQLGRPDAILRWAHYWLHEHIALVDFVKEKLHLEEKSMDLICLRPYMLCLQSEYITLAELTRWRALPGDDPVTWATDEPALIRDRAAFLTRLWQAHLMTMQKNRCRGGAPKSRYPWESTLTFPEFAFTQQWRRTKRGFPSSPLGTSLQRQRVSMRCS